MSIRTLGIAAPQFIRGSAGGRALSSTDPASLFNAFRYAAAAADRKGDPWSDSNWADGRTERRNSVLLIHDWPTAQSVLPQKIATIRPNVVFIGAMSICFRGAIDCARLIKAMLGDEVLIVLGGRHASETIYFDQASGDVIHHAGSPLRLMASGLIDPVFDVVIAGDGEHMVYELGLLVADAARHRVPAAHVAARVDELKKTPGRWIAGTFRDGQVALVSSAGADIDYDAMVAPCEAFGVTTSFDLFGGRPTAHVFSDTGRGCVYDCAFCSERISVVGAPRQTSTSASRLVSQLEAACRVINEDHGRQQASAFCEDSTLLGFSPRLVDEFCRLMESRRVSIALGGQATIDQLLNRPQLLPKLRASGFEYVFIGLETPDPMEIGGMSKDIGKKNGLWLDRADRCFELLCENDIKVGVSLLFGLGESPGAREMLFESLSRWRNRYGQPVTVSMNWAVQHPLAGNDAGTGYSYTDWAIPDSDELDVLRHFGEASTRYPLAGQPPPVLAEARAIVETIDAIRSAPSSARSEFRKGYST